MAEGIPADVLVGRARAMRALSDEDRAAAIDAARNVIGFERFDARARQIQLRDSYRKGAPA